MGFTKLVRGIVASSLMEETPEIFKIFITLLAECDADGIARVSPTYLESVCRLSEPAVARAIKKLSFPDPKSRTTTEQGRRIRRVDGGFFIINYAKFREWTYSTTPAALQKRKYRQNILRKKEKIKTQDAQDPKTSVGCFPSLTEEEAECPGHVLECPGHVLGEAEPEKPVTVTKRHTMSQEGGIYFDGLKWIGLTPDVLDSLCVKFPVSDIPEALDKMAAWIQADPSRNHPEDDRTEFIERWLKRPSYVKQGGRK